MGKSNQLKSNKPYFGNINRVSIIKRIQNKLKRIYANSSNSRKIAYLTSLDAIIGRGNVILSKVHFIGSEPYLVSIGSNCLISTNVQFFCHDGGVHVLNNLNQFFGGGVNSNGRVYGKVGKIILGNNIFIGHGSILLPNTTVGDNCIIGAGAVVCGNIPPNSVIAGVPAKVICSIDDYYQRNIKREAFLPIGHMNPDEKKKELMKWRNKIK